MAARRHLPVTIAVKRDQKHPKLKQVSSYPQTPLPLYRTALVRIQVIASPWPEKAGLGINRQSLI